MSESLERRCFEDGVRRGLLKAAMMRKSAVGGAAATAGRAAASAIQKKEWQVLGEKLFRQLKNPANDWQSLKASILPGFGQMGDLRNLIKSYSEIWHATAPADRPMFKHWFQKELNRKFRGIGEIAAPKLRFWNKTMPMAGGAAGGAGLGLAYGTLSGRSKQRQQIENRLANMPLWDRMKYLVLPQSLNTRPQFPYELRRR